MILIIMSYIVFSITIIFSYTISNYTKSDWQWYRLKEKEKESWKEKATDWESERKKLEES